MTLFLLLVLAALSGAISYISLLPDKFRVARSIVINAPPEAIYPLINDLQSWRQWSPWGNGVPATAVEQEGPPLGAGSLALWSEDRDLGKAKLKIIESSPNDRVALRLQMSKPSAQIHDLRFDLRPAGEGTEVIWQGSTRLDFMGKAFNALKGFEKKTGDRFDAGLKKLKVYVEERV